jgi:type IV pilus assembly protein PilC
MKSFHYVAQDAAGSVARGDMEANSLQEVGERLRGQDLFLISAQEISGLAGVGKGKLKLAALTVFCRQLSVMIASGMSMVRAIDILYNRAEKKADKAIYLRLAEDIQKGLSLNEAMQEQGNTFPLLLINMIRAGEMSGSLDTVLVKMADHYDRELKLLSKVKSSMAYPVILLVVTFSVMLLLFVFILPNFFTMFDGVADLPAITRGIMAISNFLIERWYVVLLVLAAIVGVFAMSKQVEVIARFYDRLKLQIPVFGKLNKRVYMSRFASSMETLYSSGVSIVDAIETSVIILNNRYVTEAFTGVMEDIRRGEMFSTALEKVDLFDGMFTSMVYMGEESGSLDEVLGKMSAFYDNDAQAAISKMVALMEPAMMVFMALLIGTVVAAVFVPMYSMYSSII